MNPEDYTGKEWKTLYDELTPRLMRNSMTRGIRAVARKALQVPRKAVKSQFNVKGNKSDLPKGIRTYISRDRDNFGFGVTVRPKRASKKQGTIEKGMHLNRYRQRKPILFWAEGGTDDRYSYSSSWKRSPLAGKKVSRKKKGHIYRGRMRAYNFLSGSEPEMKRIVTTDFPPELDKACIKVAQKAGLL